MEPDGFFQVFIKVRTLRTEASSVRIRQLALEERERRRAVQCRGDARYEQRRSARSRIGICLGESCRARVKRGSRSGVFLGIPLRVAMSSWEFWVDFVSLAIGGKLRSGLESSRSRQTGLEGNRFGCGNGFGTDASFDRLAIAIRSSSVAPLPI